MVDSTVLGFALSRALIVVPFTIWLQRYYAGKNTSITTHIVCFISWSLAFSMVYILPLDLIPTTSEALYTVWVVIYWVSFAFCWVVVPLIQGYYDTGEFRFRSRLWASIRFNVIFYLIAGVLLGAFLLWKLISDHLTGEQLGFFAMCLANTWGLVLLILMLGYGLVEVPRVTWYSGNRVVAMKKLHYTLAHLHEQAQVEQDRLSQLHTLIPRIDSGISKTGTNPLRPYVDIIIKNTPPVDSYRFAGIINSPPVEEISVIEKLKSKAVNEYTERDLADLNYVAMTAQSRLAMIEADWSDTVDSAIDLEAVTRWQHTSTPMTAAPTAVRTRGCCAVLWWRFRVFWSPIVFRILAVLFAISSLVMLYGQISLVIPTDKQISPLGAMLEALDGQIFVQQAVCLVYLIYIVMCTFYPLFRVRLSTLYHMHGGGRTNEVSLLHNGAFMLRVLPALAYNFFAVLHIEGTASQRVLGQMEAIPFLGSSFNQYFPIFICVFSVATFFNWFTRILKCLNIPKFEYSESFENEHVTEGRLLLQRERRYKEETQMTTMNGSNTASEDLDDVRLI